MFSNLLLQSKAICHNKFIYFKLLFIWLNSIVFCPYSYAEVISTMTNIIQGTAPYLTFDGGLTPASNTDELLTIQLPDGTIYSKTDNQSSLSNPIILPANGLKLGDIITFIPAGQTSISMTDLLNNNAFWHDLDGDDEIIATGNLRLVAHDIKGNEISLNDPFVDCYAPYSIMLQNDAAILSTTYGFPNSTLINANNVIYYITPPKGACSYAAQPNLTLSNSHNNGSLGSNYSGPTAEWDDVKGFKLQDINNHKLNFPTTGANNFFFLMDLMNTVANEVNYVKTPSNSGINLSITSEGGSKIKVRLMGPKAGASLNEAITAVPTSFILYSDKEKQNKIYSFTIKKWFIAQTGDGLSYHDATQYCNNLGYQLPKIEQLTNASLDDINGNIAGQPNHYQRRIGGGLFSEWGETNDEYYRGCNFKNNTNYWTLASSQEDLFEDQDLDTNEHINLDTMELNNQTVCISPD